MGRHPRISQVMRWTSESLRETDGRGVVPVFSAPDGNAQVRSNHLGCDGPFHFTYRMSILCADICARVPEFAHIDPSQVLVTFIRCRSGRPWGLQARLVPLRFRGGRLTEVRGQYRYKIQQVFVEKTEMKYVLSFYLPRFLNQSFDEKIITIFHELYHISPNFDGDIRRLEGDDPVHGGSQGMYDRRMAEFARAYLKGRPSQPIYDFLRLSFEDIERYFGEIVGLQIPTPKLIPIEKVG